MKFFQFILSISILFLFSLSSAIAASDDEDIKRYKITNISYSNYLEEGNEVRISGENLSECDSISVDGKNLDVTSPKFIYENINGLININCDGIKSTYEYGFPFIESSSVVQDDNYFYLEILGKNFSNTSKVTLDGASFEEIYTSETKIYGKIYGKITSNELYVTDESNKSNLIMMDFDYPIIEKIRSANKFLSESTIYIEGNNLENFDLYIDNKKENDFNISKDNIIEYVLPKKLEDLKIQFKKYDIESNSIDVEVQGNIPYLINSYEKSDSDSETGRILELEGLNFPFYDEDIVVYINDKKQQVSNVSGEKITIKDFEYSDGDNYIYVVVNELQSNVLHHFQDVELPYPTSITDVDFTEDQRILTIGLQGFNEDTDSILINNSRVSILSCYSTVCRVGIKKSLLEGKITVKRGDLQHKNFVEFDYKTGAEPHIQKVTFSDEIKGLTKFTIYGNNLSGVSVSGSNMFTTDDNKVDVDITNDTIKGRLPRDYKEGQSSINVSKNSMSSSFSFSTQEVIGNTVRNAPLITEIRPENKSFLQSGKTMYLRGYGFNNGDKLIIDDIQYELDFSQGYAYPEVILDSNIETGFYEIYIQSKNDKISNKIKKFISQNSTPEIDFEIKSLGDKQYYYNQGGNTTVFSMNIYNGIEDVIISQLEFLLKGSDSLKDFGGLDLYIDSKKVSSGYVDSDGSIIFLDQILLEQSNDDIILELKTSDKFFAQGEFYIIYLGNKTDTYISDQQVFINKKLLQGDTFIVNDRKFYNCYNQKGNNVLCDDETLEVDTNSSSNSNQEAVNEDANDDDDDITQDNSTQSSYNNNEITIEEKIDLVVEQIYNKQSKKSTYSTLIYFKNLKIKLSRITTGLSDSHNQKDLLLYLEEKVDDKYKIIFKKYVAEKKAG